MVAVFADAEHVEDVADEFPQVSVAAYNGPNTVLSGPGADLEQIVATCGDDGIRCTWLDTSHAFHSELLEPVLDEFESYAAQFKFAVPTLPLVCNRTGAVLTAATPLNAQYWRRHSRQPVQFAESVRTVAPAGMLGVDGDRSATDSDRAPRCRSGRNPRPRRVRSPPCARAPMPGVRSPKRSPLPTSPGIGPSSPRCTIGPRRRLELPTYPFQRRHYLAQDRRASAQTAPLGPESWVAQRTSPPATPSTPAGCRVKSQPWLSDHVIYGTVVVPGATYVAMALAAVEAPARVQRCLLL